MPLDWVFHQLVDKGTSGTNYVVQLTGESASKGFRGDGGEYQRLATDIPTGFSADASVSVNGLTFTRATNSITDIIPGVTLNVNSATTGAASVAPGTRRS